MHARVPPFILPGPHHAGRAHRTGGYTVLTQFVRLLASAHVRLARPRRAPPPGCPGGALAVMAVMAWPGLFVPTVGRVLPAGVIRDEGWVPGCIIFSQLLYLFRVFFVIFGAHRRESLRVAAPAGARALPGEQLTAQ